LEKLKKIKFALSEKEDCRLAESKGSQDFARVLTFYDR